MQYEPASYDPGNYARTPYKQAPNAKAAYGGAPYGQPYYEQTPYGQTTYAQTPYAQTPGGQTPDPQASYVQAPYGERPYRQRDQHSDYVSVVEGEQKQKSQSSGWATIAMVCAAVLVLLGIVLGTALLTDNMGEHIATTTAQEVPDVLSHPFSVVVQIPQISTGSTPSLVVATTTPVATKGAPITAPPRSSSTAQPSTHHIPEGVGKQQLVCIMGEGLTSVHQLPQDEVCDYIFYDSLYKNGTHNLLSDPSTYSEGLNVFLNNRRGYRHTTLGIGLAFDFLAKANEDLQYAKNPSPLERFWKRSIFHAGILDTPMQPTRNDTRSAIKILERIKRLVDIRRGVTAITAISLPHPNIAWAASFAEDFRALRFTPSIVISIGHYRRADDKHSVCAIMPPTRHPDDIPSERVLRAYDFDLSTPITLLSWLYSNGTDTKGVVSVTLKGRWTRPVNFRNTGFYGACSSVDIPFGSYTEVCPSGGPMSTAPLNYSTKHHAMITYISKIRRTFTYDDERAFAEKLCRVKALRTDVPFGIAVYDVDYDDYYNSCYTLNLYRAYSRLKALRKVVNYFKKETAPFDEAACRTFVTG